MRVSTVLSHHLILLYLIQPLRSYEIITTISTWELPFSPGQNHSYDPELTICDVIAVRGYLKERCQIGGKWFYKCPFSPHLYSLLMVRCRKQEFSLICPEDPSFYQSCGHILCRDTQLMGTSAGVCGETLCETQYTDVFRKTTRYLSNLSFGLAQYICDGQAQCLNTINGTAADELGCAGVDDSQDLFGCAPCHTQHNVIPRQLVCNKVCDCVNCYDEAHCPSSVGLVCKINKGVATFCQEGEEDYIEPKKICDGFSHCVDGGDEQGCDTRDTCPTNNILYNRDTNVRQLHPLNKCAIPAPPQKFLLGPLCLDYRDQMNCTNSSISPLTCEVGGYPTTISEYVICEGHSLCDDNLDTMCQVFGADCKIHKHRLCDGVIDCPGSADEILAECQMMTNVRCMRRYSYSARSTRIPSTWLLDGVRDCESGVDEDRGSWYKDCGTGDSVSFSYNHTKSCDTTTLLKCPHSDSSLDISKVCTGYDNCDRNLCERSRRGYKQVAKTENFISSRRAFYCLPGLASLEQHIGHCSLIPLQTMPIYGVGIPLISTSPEYGRRVSCRSVFGEQYVYLVCTNQYDTAVPCACPLKPTPQTACRNLNRAPVFTITQSRDLTLAFERRDGSFEQNIFACGDGQCIGLDRVCDLVQDCTDSSDESTCSNNFHCMESGEFIAHGKKCDGVFDCLDYTDECNRECDNQLKMFMNDSVFVLACVLGFVATFLNARVIMSSVQSFYTLKSGVAVVNESFVLVVSSGDLLQGIFVLLAAISDKFFNRSTCKTQFHWVSSHLCTSLGVISTIGSLVSLYSMTSLSVIRALGLRSLSCSKKPLSRKHKTVLGLYIAGIYLVAVTVAITPIIEQLDSVFVRTVTFDGNPLFVGSVDRKRLLSIIEAYYGRLSDHVSLSWKLLDNLVGGMFTNSNVHGEKIGFYGGNGFCLFNYFVQADSPHFAFSWIVLMFNIVCVSIITISYTSIHFLAGESINLAGGQNKVLRDRNVKLQRKISIIIFTDILSWVPFFTVWLIHVVEIFSTASWYSIFSIIILPSNSILNPILILEDDITEKVRRFRKWIIPGKGERGGGESRTKTGPSTGQHDMSMGTV